MKYVLVGDYVLSKSDNDLHFVSSSRLIGLYGLKRTECYLTDSKSLESFLRGHREELQLLYPRFNGDYKEYLQSVK